jgi:hypothetical protein
MTNEKAPKDRRGNRQGQYGRDLATAIESLLFTDGADGNPERYRASTLTKI